MKVKLKINVASKNTVKTEAVREMLCDYTYLRESKACGVEVETGISDQPKSLEETMRGAINRARNAFRDCDYSFGIESGLIAVPNTETGFMNVVVCAIYDGKKFHLGISSAWEVPKKIHDLIHNEGLDMNEAALCANYTENRQLGSSEGLIGILSKGRLTRKMHTKEAIRTALIHLETCNFNP